MHSGAILGTKGVHLFSSLGCGQSDSHVSPRIEESAGEGERLAKQIFVVKAPPSSSRNRVSFSDWTLANRDCCCLSRDTECGSPNPSDFKFFFADTRTQPSPESCNWCRHSKTSTRDSPRKFKQYRVSDHREKPFRLISDYFNTAMRTLCVLRLYLTRVAVNSSFVWRTCYKL